MMFDSFKKDVRVYCADMEQLGRMVEWAMPHLGLSHMTRTTISVQAIKPDLLDEDRSLRGFYIYVPYEAAAKRINRLSVQDAFADILTP
jgi:hypothetical protein